MSDAPGRRRWEDAALSATLFAIDPTGTAGVCLRAPGGPVRDAWLDLLRALLPAGTPIRRVPAGIADDRLIGGLDLAATLGAGRPVAQRGVLAEADGGVVLVAMAERLSGTIGARLSAVLDSGEVALERDGLTERQAARLGMVALDEGMAEDEGPPAGLLDRLAFHVDLDGIPARDPIGPVHPAFAVADARALLPAVHADDAILEALCATALALGAGSVRGPILALHVARAAAALDRRTEVSREDATLAARLVFTRRATRLPQPEETPGSEPDADDPPPFEDSPPQDDPPDLPEGWPRDGPPKPEAAAQALADAVLAATLATMPGDLLSRLQLLGSGPARSQSSGRAGQIRQSKQHGRPIGTRRGELRGGARLHVIETLKAAAPWQLLRRSAPGPGRIEIRRDDFRVVRFKQRIGTTTIFVVDASGSAALQRLAEAKGAVELLLADCYVRRDRVALIAFRGPGAELLLPPTGSLVRAKRSLAGLPGGGGTPLAAGIEAACALADTVLRAGQTPIITLLTDGRANIARDGSPGRAVAEQEALGAARKLRTAGFTALLVDISPRPNAAARQLAAEMRAHYLALPYADAAALSEAIRTETARAPGRAASQ